MNVLIRCTKTVEFARNVEMTKQEFDKYNKALESNDYSETKAAEKKLGKLIDEEDDWQDSEIERVELEEWAD